VDALGFEALEVGEHGKAGCSDARRIRAGAPSGCFASNPSGANIACRYSTSSTAASAPGGTQRPKHLEPGRFRVRGATAGIEFTGLRPGEKLYEELLADSEATLPTTVQRLRVARIAGAADDAAALAAWVARAEAVGSDDAAARALLRQCVPEPAGHR
jgi:hypothetical protein